jgi:hypothetical protein
MIRNVLKDGSVRDDMSGYVIRGTVARQAEIILKNSRKKKGTKHGSYEDEPEPY